MVFIPSYKQLMLIAQRYVIEELKQDNTTHGGWTIDTQSYSTGFTFFNRVTKVRTYRPNHALVSWYYNRKSLNHKYIIR